MQSSTQVKQQMQQALLTLEEDLRTLRPGRASSELVSSLPVACYGSSSPLQQVAATSVDEQGQLIIQVWDKSVLGAVEAAVRQSQLGFSIVNDGQVLRLSVPPLSQERRQEMVKLVGQKGEATRIRLRQIRSDTLQQATKAKASGEVREDELSRLTKECNELIDDFNQQVKVLVERKEKELLTA